MAAEETELNVRPPEQRAFAGVHRATAVSLRQWATAEDGFPYQFVETHGLANYASFVGLVGHFGSRNVAGASFGLRNDSTGNGLDNAAMIEETTDNNAGADIRTA